MSALPELDSPRPRLGFLGVGWIGRNRLEAIRQSGVATIAAVADASRELAAEVANACEADVAHDLEELLRSDVDGIVIATPSALHASQAIAAIESGRAVFCQKPLGRNAAETRAVIDAARAHDVLLGVDLSYRHTAAVQAIRAALPEIGDVFAADLVFHNAYGPDKPWFYDAAQSGGGCVIDLGIHLVDLAMWLLDLDRIDRVTSRLFMHGSVEHFATATLDTPRTNIRLACSWNLPAGRDAVIEASFYGTRGALALRNVDGSFYDFVAERHHGTRREVLAEPPDAWGGRAAEAWARQLATGARFDPAIESAGRVANVLDAIYAAGGAR
ncbi:MAG TPA: Gfo/Idh/MocA family oxidoreductase [Thermoanaerobaculia bacterium]